MNAWSAGIWHIADWEVVLRMALAAALGGLIGLEREYNGHAAGFRTHILVCLGSAMIMLLSIYGFARFASDPGVRLDPARLAAQVVSGIGFLGAGAIMRNGSIVRGLTTAASIWVVAGIGLCAGAGFYLGAFFGTFVALISLYVLSKLEKRWPRHSDYREVKLQLAGELGELERIKADLAKQGVQLAGLRIEMERRDGEGGRSRLKARLQLQVSDLDLWLAALETLAANPAVTALETRDYPPVH